MKESLKTKKVILGNEKYTYYENEKEEILMRTHKSGTKEIKVILKSPHQSNTENIEKYIIEVLSDLYIQRNVQELI